MKISPVYVRERVRASVCVNTKIYELLVQLASQPASRSINIYTPLPSKLVRKLQATTGLAFSAIAYPLDSTSKPGMHALTRNMENRG